MRRLLIAVVLSLGLLPLGGCINRVTFTPHRSLAPSEHFPTTLTVVFPEGASHLRERVDLSQVFLIRKFDVYYGVAIRTEAVGRYKDAFDQISVLSIKPGRAGDRPDDWESTPLDEVMDPGSPPKTQKADSPGEAPLALPATEAEWRAAGLKGFALVITDMSCKYVNDRTMLRLTATLYDATNGTVLFRREVTAAGEKTRQHNYDVGVVDAMRLSTQSAAQTLFLQLTPDIYDKVRGTVRP